MTHLGLQSVQVPDGLQEGDVFDVICHPNPEAVSVYYMLLCNQGALPPAVRGMSKKERREALPGWERYWRRCEYSDRITG